MTSEQRYKIICKREILGEKQKDIAADLGITPQAITNDKKRHAAEWEALTLEIQEKSETLSQLFQDETLRHTRALLHEFTDPEKRLQLLLRYPKEAIALAEIILCNFHVARLERRNPEDLSSNGEVSTL